MTTTRLAPSERRHFTMKPQDPKCKPEQWGFEPALGTLEQRLDILSHRFGGAKTVRLSAAERDAYQAWLDSQ